jgi:hypothetical protein
MACRRQMSSTFAPASCPLSTPITCSSLKRLCLLSLPPRRSKGGRFKLAMARIPGRRSGHLFADAGRRGFWLQWQPRVGCQIWRIDQSHELCGDEPAAVLWTKAEICEWIEAVVTHEFKGHLESAHERIKTIDIAVCVYCFLCRCALGKADATATRLKDPSGLGKGASMCEQPAGPVNQFFEAFHR